MTQPTYVLTVGCFDLFHRGHEALLDHMISLGATKLLIGVHDDESVFINKGVRVAQPWEQRAAALTRYAPSLVETFPVTDSDPTPALQEIYARYSGHVRWIYCRADDLPQFPGRPFAESKMPIVWHPYTQGISSTMLRNKK